MGTEAEARETLLTGLLSYKFQDHLPIVGLGPLHQLLIKNTTHRLPYHSPQWRHFLSIDFLFPDNCSLGQVDKKPIRTKAKL